MVLMPLYHTLFRYLITYLIRVCFQMFGVLLPLHEKGSQTNAENYRGITLLSVLGKILTCVVNNRLDNWAEMYRIYVEAQNGFWTGRGTTDSCFILYNMINDFLNQGDKLYAFFIDFSKAFDYEIHDNLWFKLFNIGLGGKIVNIIRSMYRSVRTKVVNNNESSESFPCTLGVRQCEWLPPFLFAIYVNDLETYLHEDDAGVTILDVKFLLLLYADDVVIFAETPEGLQKRIDKLFRYCQRWKLILNMKKS